MCPITSPSKRNRTQLDNNSKHLIASSIKDILSDCKHSKMLIRNFTPSKLRFIREHFTNIEKQIQRIQDYTEVETQ